MGKRLFLITSVLLLLAGWPAYGQNASEAEPEVLDMEAIEVVEDLSQIQQSTILGLEKYQWLTFSGPLIWGLMVIGIGTRHIKIKGKAKQLMKLHRFCGYSALVVGTLHGILGLFF